MKNIHALPTDKPSRLTKPGGSSSIKLYTNGLTNTPKGHCKNYHLYITSDEEIKFDEYYLGEDSNIYCLVSGVNSNGKKIILTTDQDLIKDGVQAIDDEFLEWFVKNPNCEEVEVTKVDTFKKTNEVYVDEITGGNYYEIIKHNKIILPQEEPKQETIEELDYNKIIEQSLVELRKQPMSFVPDKIMYSEEEVRTAIFTSFLLGVDRGFYSKEIEDKIIQKLKKK